MALFARDGDAALSTLTLALPALGEVNDGHGGCSLGPEARDLGRAPAHERVEPGTRRGGHGEELPAVSLRLLA